MKRQESQTLQMLTNVADLGAKIVGVFPKTTAAAELVEALESGVKKLSDDAAVLASIKADLRSNASARAASRTKLRTCLSVAHQIARALNIDHVPAPNRMTEAGLIQTGNAFVIFTGPVKSDFVLHGLPSEHVVVAVESLKQAILTHTAAKARYSAGKHEWRKTMTETLGKLRRFDALVSAVLRDKPGTMASYTIARSVPAGRARKAAAASPPASATPA